jgi:uncharacterized protein with GYD domain
MNIKNNKKGVEQMPTYVILSKLTTEGRKTVKSNPGRIKEVNVEIQGALGVKGIAQYALLGPYDFLTILEAPGNEEVAKVAMELGSRGTVETMTLPAMKLDTFITALS